MTDNEKLLENLRKIEDEFGTSSGTILFLETLPVKPELITEEFKEEFRKLAQDFHEFLLKTQVRYVDDILNLWDIKS